MVDEVMEPAGEEQDEREERGERVMAVDYGERRVGLALAEPGAPLVRGLPTIDRRKLKGSLAKAVGRVAAEQRVDRILLGIPFELDGAEGPAARAAREFGSELAVRSALPVEEWDERLSTEAARTRLRQIGYSEREMRERIDQLAAVLMLEGYVRRRSGGGAGGGEDAAAGPEDERR